MTLWMLRALGALSGLVARLRDDRGQGLTEYALIIALIAVAVVAIVVTLGKQIGDVFTHVTNCLGNAASC